MQELIKADLYYQLTHPYFTEVLSCKQVACDSFRQKLCERFKLSLVFDCQLEKGCKNTKNRPARGITGATYDIRSSDLLLENLNWKPLEERRNYTSNSILI